MSVNGNDVIRTTVDMRLDGTGVVQNTFHTQYTGAVISSDQVVVNAIRVHLESSYYVVIQPDLVNDITFQAYINFNVTQGVPMPDAVPTLVTAGTDLAEPLPPQNAALMSFPTATAKSIGRKYVPSYGENANDGNGLLDAGVLARLLTAGVNLVGTFSISIGNGELGNYVDLTASFRAWTGSRADTLFRTQRRRVLGVGV